MKAITTHYNGYAFRSRLEARWAVFFDALGIHYEYEQEGYDLDGVYYLPDFYIPAWDKFIEIKPLRKPLSNEEAIKMWSLVAASGKTVILICGQPYPCEYVAMRFIPNQKEGIKKPYQTTIDYGWYQFAYGLGDKLLYFFQVDKEKWKPINLTPQGLSPLSWEWVTIGDDMVQIFNPHQPALYNNVVALAGGRFRERELRKSGTALDLAYLAARKARFEHGQKGATP